MTYLLAFALFIPSLALAAPEKLLVSEIQTMQVCYDRKWPKCLMFQRQADSANLNYQGPFGTQAKRKISIKEMQHALQQLLPMLVNRTPAAVGPDCLSPQTVEITTDSKTIQALSCPQDSKQLNAFYLWAARQIQKVKAQP